MEWEANADTFIFAAIERQYVRNLYSPLDGVLNTRADVTNLDRLRSRVLPLPPKPDALEDTPVFSEGNVTRATMAVEYIVNRSLAAQFNYTYSDSTNTLDAFRGNLIPYLPHNQVSLGATWTIPARGYFSAQAVYRSVRYSDEGNQFKLEAGWDLRLRGYVEFDSKHWSLEAYALNLLKKNESDVFGVILNYRF